MQQVVRPHFRLLAQPAAIPSDVVGARGIIDAREQDARAAAGRARLQVIIVVGRVDEERIGREVVRVRTPPRCDAITVLAVA